MSDYSKTEAKLRALAAQREAERWRNCPTPGCRLEEGHAGLHRFLPEVERLRARVAELEADLRASRAAPRAPDPGEETVRKRLAQVLDAYERRRTGFALGYEEETAIVESALAALASSSSAPATGPRCDAESEIQASKTAPLAFGIESWPLADVLERLADAADHLRGAHNCDAQGHEGVLYAAQAAREHVKLLRAASAPDTACKACGLDEGRQIHINVASPLWHRFVPSASTPATGTIELHWHRDLHGLASACPSCSGSGKYEEEHFRGYVTTACRTCHGTGRAPRSPETTPGDPDPERKDGE